MKNTLALDLKQAQQLRLMPQQLQLGRMLELNDQEIEELINLTVHDNPVLEFKEESSDLADKGQDVLLESGDAPVRYEYDNSSLRSKVDDAWLNNLNSESEETLTEHLMGQLAELSLSEDDMAVAQYMVGCLDPNGYITRTRQGISDDFLIQRGQDLTAEQINRVWNTLRSLDPPGIGATDLRDCLLMQLERLHKNTPAHQDAAAIIEHHFDDFLKGNRQKLAKSSKLSSKRIDDATAVISKLNPKPGREFAANRQEAVTLHVNADFSVLPDLYRDGHLEIKVLSDFPELTVDDTYRIADSQAPKAATQLERKQRRDAALFLKEKCREADNFIAMIKMRQNTLLTVIKAIVGRQKEFFLTGDTTQLKPMGLKDLSADTGFDQSMLSRATSGRHVLTTAGLLPLKTLFNNKRPDGTEQGTTANQIITLMQEMVNREDPGAPLTDDQIAAALKDRGITIARRTVAKYRDIAGIPALQKRKQLKSQ